MPYPVHRPNWLIVAGTVLSGVVDAIVIIVVLGLASRAKKLALGKDGLTNVIVGRVPGSARAARARAPSRQPGNPSTLA